MKTLHKRTRGGVLLSLILALALGAGLVSCASDDNTTENETVTITLVSESRTSGTSYTIEKDTAIADITGYVDPTKDGYTFGGWQDADGKAYSTSTKINSSVTLFAKWSAKPNTVSNTDGTTTTTTESQVADGSSSTTEVTKDSEGKTTRTKTTTEKSDGTKVTETVSDGKTTTETVNADNSSSTTTVTTASDGTTTTTTETKDSSGNSTGKKVVEEKEDGTVTTTETDADGKSTTISSTKDYKKYISEGIANLESATPDIESAISNFNKAYETEANDETRVYSALASLASISTTSATASFFKNHLGITNYPSTMNALFNGAWMEEAEYIDYNSKNVYGFTFKEKSPYDEINASLPGYSSFTESGSSSNGSTYYRCTVTKVDSYNKSDCVFS